ncbi:MAG: autotransporter assembly complex family protein [Pseudoruegeria sp.]
MFFWRPSKRKLKTLAFAGVSTLALSIPGAVWALSDVVVNTAQPDADLVERLRNASLSAAALAEESTNVQDVIAAARADYGRILGALYGQGYYNGVISIKVDGREAADIEPFSPPSSINQIVISVDQGNQFKFSRAVVEPLPKGAEIPAGYAVDEIAKSGTIGSAANAGIKAWKNVGHAKADLGGQSVKADHKSNTLNSEVTLNPGPKLTFGPLTLDNRGIVRDERVLQIAGYPEGDVFSPDEVNEISKRLRRTGTFSLANVTEAENIGANNTLPMTLIVDDQKPRRISFGGELSTTEGVTLSALWMHRNFLGGAETFEVRGEIANIGGLDNATGGVDYYLGTRLTRPAIYGADTNGSVFANIEQNDDPGYFERKAVIGIGATRIFSDELSAEVGLGLRYSEYQDDFGDREFYHLTIPARVIWDKRDDEFNPTQDFYLEGKIEPFVGFGGSKTGAQITGDLRGYLGFGEQKKFVLAGRAQLGSVVGTSIEETPPDYLFFSGGSGTVRGHTYQSLFLTLPGDIETGGKSFVGFSLEARSLITESIGLVGFFDIGYIGADSYPTDESETQSGAGIGLRYNTGIGPIRFDVGYPVSGLQDSEDDGVKIYIGIGQAF